MNSECPLCGSDIISHCGDVGRYPLRECRACGLQFLHPAPDSIELERIYADYYRPWDLENHAEEVATMKRKTFEGYLRMVAPFVPAGRLLDVGCATGELMEAASDMGYDVYGTEISPQGVARCCERFGVERVVPRQLERSDFQAGFFDIVTMCDVIEHIPDACNLLDTVACFLRSGGILLMVTPDTSSWSRRLLGLSWPHYKQEHLQYHNRTTIIRLLGQAFIPLVVGRASKSLTISYCLNIAKAYRSNPALSGLANVSRLLPRTLLVFPFRVGFGEMLIIAQKVG